MRKELPRFIEILTFSLSSLNAFFNSLSILAATRSTPQCIYLFSFIVRDCPTWNTCLKTPYGNTVLTIKSIGPPDENDSSTNNRQGNLLCCTVFN